jgi:hypothetical protein
MRSGRGFLKSLCNLGHAGFLSRAQIFYHPLTQAFRSFCGFDRLGQDFAGRLNIKYLIWITDQLHALLCNLNAIAIRN